jgi:predicted PurR-regulated permease PerM
MEPGAAMRATPPQVRGRHPTGVPWSLRAASEWAWRFLVIAVAVILALYLLVRLRLIVFPVIVALFITALLAPAVNRLQDNGMRRGAATAVVFVGSLLLLIGLPCLGASSRTASVTSPTTFSRPSTTRRSGSPSRPSASMTGISTTSATTSGVAQAEPNEIFSGAIGTATLVGEVITGLLLTLFTTFFFLYDASASGAGSRRSFRGGRSACHGVRSAGADDAHRLCARTILIAPVDGVCIGLLLLISGCRSPFRSVSLPLRCLRSAGRRHPDRGSPVLVALPPRAS